MPCCWRACRVAGSVPVYASDAPETPAVRIGIIALTDCSSIVMAHELGLFKKYGIEATISKEASWAVIRDRLNLGENQASHLLLGIAYSSTMGLLGSPVKPMIIPCYLNRNGQAITLKKEFLTKGVKTPETLKPQAEAAKQAGTPLTFAMTFPPGTHAMWMRYWLASGGIHPDKDITLITIPPAQMVANMKVGKMDGFCVGEPWNARAIAMALVLQRSPRSRCGRITLKKCWASLKSSPAKTPRPSKLSYGLWWRPVSTSTSSRIGRMSLRWWRVHNTSTPRKKSSSGACWGSTTTAMDVPSEQDKYYMTFFDRHTNFPWKSHGIWWLTQFRRWGMVKEGVDYAGLANRVHRPDIYREVAKEMSLDVPQEDMRKETLFDGITFDPAQPEEYARGFRRA